MQKPQFACISLTVRDRVTSSKFFEPQGILANYALQFSRKFSLPKNGGHFEFLPKMQKHRFASISLTMRDRAISLKFSTHRVSKQCTIGNFPKIFLPPQKWQPF